MILVFGSLNMDLVMQMEHLPQPGETVICPGYVLKAGGKGNNQAVAAARAGARVAMAGALGRDGFGDSLAGRQKTEGIDIALIARGEAPTGCAPIAIDAAGENFIVVAGGANLTASQAAIPQEKLGSGTLVVLQMEVPHAENWALLARAKAAGARTLLNVAPAAAVPEAALGDVDFLAVNEIEAVQVAHALGIMEAEPLKAAAALARRYDLSCVVTLGAQGAALVTADGGWRVQPLKVEVVDTTGAGDAFVGNFAAALDAGLAPQDALRRASVAGSLACTAVGAQEALPHRADVDAKLAGVPAATPL